MLSRPRNRLRRGENGSVVITAVLVMAIMIPIGLALLSLVDTQARQSGSERSRDRAFNLADSALHSAAFSLGRSAWPASAAAAPSNSGSVGASALCGQASYGATLGASTFAGSATARLQPNLNASYDDTAYTGAAWQVNVCDNTASGPGASVWAESLLTSSLNYDANGDQLVWVRSQGRVSGRTRVLAALVRVSQTPAFSSKYGLLTGRMNAEVTNTVGTVLGGGLLGNLASALLGTDPLVAPDPTANTTPPTSGVTAVRCGALDGCLAGAIGGLSSAVNPLNALIVGGKLVQTTSTTATSETTIGQLKQQAMNSSTYVASTAGGTSSATAPACTIPAGANSNTVVYIDKVGTTGSAGTSGGPGDQFCYLSVSANVTYRALVIGSGRVILRGNNTTASGGVNTFTGLLYALNRQRFTLGDAALPAREVIRIERGAHVVGGVAADGKSAQVGIYPPPVCDPAALLGLGCTLTNILSITGILNTYNPAITSNVAVMNAVKSYDKAAVVAGSYKDVRGEVK